MTTSTPLGLPVPEDTDPLGDAGLHIRTLATAVDELRVIKASDQICNNDATLNDDDDFTFSAEAGKRYAIEIHMLFRCGSSAVDAKVALARSHASGDLNWSLVGLDPAASAGTTGDAQLGGVYQGTGADFVEAGVASGVTGVHLYGTYDSPAANSDVTLRWCQKTATATDLILSTGSYMIVKVIP